VQGVYRFLVAAVGALLIVGAVFPEQPKDSQEVERLIKQLGSKEDKVHEAATKRLEALGDPALPALKAAATSDDFDTRLRAYRLLEPMTKRLELRRFEGHGNTVMSVAFSPDGKQALSGGWDPVVRLWDLEKGGEERRLTGHRETVWGVAFSPDGRRALSLYVAFRS
jgi:WD40 repeat protein